MNSFSHDYQPQNQNEENNKSILSFLSTLLKLGGKKLFLTILALLTLSLVLYFVFSGDGLMKITALKTEKTRLEADLKILTKENEKLKQQIERIKTDPGYMEDEARRKLGLIKPGETIYRLAEEPDWGINKNKENKNESETNE